VLDDVLETHRAYLPQFWPAAPAAPASTSDVGPGAHEVRA
jgi:hypothetical protein